MNRYLPALSDFFSIFIYSTLCFIVLQFAFAPAVSAAVGAIAGFFLGLFNSIYQLLRVEFGKRT
mgnify:FL=1